MAETTTGSPPLTIPGIEDLEPVGRGGFGTVYRGWQPALRRQVAVKVLDARATDPEAAARFTREGMAMGAVSGHPNVVPVYSTGTVDDRLYLVMPYLEDGSLADRLADGPLPPDEVISIGRDLADAVAAAHAAGVLHRDVKPANVLRTPYGSLQLADFGVARFVDTTQTLGGDVTATVPYAAPEVLSGEASSETSDVYSLGATLHAALRGRPPYEARPDEAAIAVAVRVLSADPPDLREAGVPDALASVIERAMARDVAQRYQTAAELRDAFEALDLAGPAVDATAITPATTVMAPVPPPSPPATAPSAVAAPTPPTTARPRRAERQGRGQGWVLVVLGLLVAGAAAALLLLGGDGDDPGSAPTTTAVPSTTAPPGTDPTDTSADATTTTAAPAAEEPAAEEPGAATDPEEAVRSYYALMDAGRIEEGFARLSPAYQERTGEASYRGFWETVAGVEVLEASGDGDTATATLLYRLQDGSTSRERVTLRFVEAPDGTLLIDDYQVG